MPTFKIEVTEVRTSNIIKEVDAENLECAIRIALDTTEPEEFSESDDFDTDITAKEEGSED